MLLNRFRLQEAVRKEGAPGGEGGGGAAEWLKPFGDKAPQDWAGFKEPTELATKWTEMSTELTTLKGKQAPDWRKQAVTVDGKEDENLTKTISRYNDLPSVAKALFEAQTKIRTGDIAKPLPKDATPEQKAEWRKANGIPAEAKEYFANLPDGLVIGKEDAPMFEAVSAMLHEHNVPPTLAHGLAKWYYDGLAKTKADEAAVDHQDRQKAISELRNTWGNDYDANMRIMGSMLDGLHETDKALLMDATLGDGTRLFNSTKHVEFLAGLARKLNPAAHLLPPGGEGNMASIDTEITNLEKMMGDPKSEYWKGPKADANQKRYRDLVAARDQLKRR